MTDLSDREIVLGKLAARLVPVLVMIAATLPVMELLTLLGGVDPDALLKAFIVTLAVAVLGCCLALVFSIRVRKTHKALLATYAVWGLWLLGAPMLNQLSRAIGLSQRVRALYVDPFWLAFALTGGLGRWAGLTISASSAEPWESLLCWLCTRSGRCDGCARETSRRKRGLGPGGARQVTRRPRSWCPAGSTGRDRALISIRCCGASGIATGHRHGRDRCDGLLCAGIDLQYFSDWRRPTPMAPWVNALQVSIGLLFLSVTAATSLAEERARGSLDVLMTTPMETAEIVIGKWLGTCRLVPPLAILPPLVVVGIAKPGIGWPMAIVTVAFILAAGATVASLGLAMATWCPRLGRAVGLTVSLYLLAAVGWCLAIAAITHGPSPVRRS